MASSLKVTSTTDNLIALREGLSEIQHRQFGNIVEYILGMTDVELASVGLPDCPDVDPYYVEVRQVIDLGSPHKIRDWLSKSLPVGEYLINCCHPPNVSSDNIWFGQAKVPAQGVMSIFFDEDPYYGVGVIGGTNEFAGAILLAVCVPDFLLDTSKHCIILIQIASTESRSCYIVIPQNDQFCLCLNDSFGTRADISLKLRKWYIQKGAQEISTILDMLPYAVDETM
ncbi:hypothetical protein CA11_19770 [Gimesia maris]|uniref:hypothetical protein n=1 Tax=Gimesia maris TaxID=122 RepID=UPI001188C081|nr:hypothetical protein [Gimesia maris]QDU14173.1 hypothetical protein CA11_19770 [Gimesia maris]